MRKMRGSRAVFALAVLVGLVVVGCKGKEKVEERVFPVEVAEVGYVEFPYVVRGIGQVEAKFDTYVNAKVGGRIEEISKDKGDMVEKGEVLARIEKRDYELALDAAEAEFARTQALYKDAEANFQRVKKLFEGGAIAKSKYDNAEAQFKAAKAAFEAAEANLELAQRNLRETEILAPFDGAVVERFVSPGIVVGSDAPLFRVVKLSPIKVVVSVAEEARRFVREGDTAKVTVEGYPGSVFEGEIASINKAVSPLTGTFDVEVLIENKDKRLLPGMLAKVEILGQRQRVLAVPREALTRMPATGVFYVYAVEKDRTRKVRVECGQRYGDFVEIKKGLKEKDRVIVSGTEIFRGGERVKISKVFEPGEVP